MPVRASQQAGMVQGAGKALRKAAKKGGLNELKSLLKPMVKGFSDSGQKENMFAILKTLAAKISSGDQKYNGTVDLFQELCECPEYKEVLADPEYGPQQVSTTDTNGKIIDHGTVSQIAGLGLSAPAARIQRPEVHQRQSSDMGPLYEVPAKLTGGNQGYISLAEMKGAPSQESLYDVVHTEEKDLESIYITNQSKPETQEGFYDVAHRADGTEGKFVLSKEQDGGGEVKPPRPTARKPNFDGPPRPTARKPNLDGPPRPTARKPNLDGPPLPPKEFQ